MTFLQNFDWSGKSILKALGILLAGAVTVSIAVALISFAVRTVFDFDSYDRSYKGGYGGGGFAESTANFVFEPRSIGIPMPPRDGYVDEQAEEYEVQDYNVSYRTHDKTRVCTAIAGLKPREDIIFERANESDRNCDYSFKVPKEKAEEILTLLEELDPEYLNASTYTIQRAVEGLTDELSILQNKLTEIEMVLAEAQQSYSELTKLATRKQDVESLTKLIELKLNTIERLSNERRSINEQIERLAKQKNEQLERIKYVNFSVSVYEDPFVDWKRIGDSWKNEIQYFVTNFNDMLQSVTVGLVTFALRAVQGLVYLFLGLLLLKFAWLIGKRVWRGRE